MRTGKEDSTITRGYGLLEKWLAQQRASIADQHIPTSRRSGRILDIGCGSYPFFLMNTQFSEKVGIDPAVKKTAEKNMSLLPFDLREESRLPFDDSSFDVVTMLAVFEHIEPTRVVGVLSEIYRLLKPGGIYILTTPAGWTDKLLRSLAALRIVSPEEIADHKAAYDHAKILSLLDAANFQKSCISYGFFELGMNLWVTATKNEGRA